MLKNTLSRKDAIKKKGTMSPPAEELKQIMSNREKSLKDQMPANLKIASARTCIKYF